MKGEASQTTPEELGASSPDDKRSERRRRMMRRAGNSLIILALVGLLGIVLYFVGTCAYTAKQQDVLGQQLAEENPGLDEAIQGIGPEDFMSPEEIEAARQLAALDAAAWDYWLKMFYRVGKAIGKISIPSIGVDAVVVQGDFQGRSEDYLRKGPGHWRETPMPGQGGSVVISGHRTTYGAQFRKLNDLQPGDEIELTMPYAVLKYTVTQVLIVAPDEVQAVADQGKEMLSLVACHPIYSAKQRIIAQADMTSFVLLEAGQ